MRVEAWNKDASVAKLQQQLKSTTTMSKSKQAKMSLLETWRMQN
jgi:hypothetical protein